MLKISEELLQDLYTNKNFTSYQIADELGCCKATIIKKLKASNIDLRLPGPKRVNLDKNQLMDLYINKKISSWNIGKMLKIPRSTIYRKLRKFKIVIRDISEAHIVYRKSNFSGDLIEKAYLIGFRIGDLGVRKQYKKSHIICVATGSTIKEQIDLFKILFEKYGHVWSKQAKNNKFNVQVNLNESFDFLLSKEFPDWVENKKETFFSFLAGFSDAEGCISKSKGKDYYSLGNYDKPLLIKIQDNIHRYGITCRGLYTDKRKGTVNSEGYIYSSNYSSIKIHAQEDLLRFLYELRPYVKHKNKVKSLNLAIDSLNQKRAKKQ